MPSGSGSSVNPAEAYQRGVAALQAQNYETAIREFRAVTRAIPNEPTAQYLLGLSYIGAGQHEDARRPLERATRRDEAPPDAWRQLGIVYLAQGDRAKAEEQMAALTSMLSECGADCGDARRVQIEAAKTQLQLALDAAQAPAANPTTGWLPPGVGEGRAAYANAVGLINGARYEEALAALAAAREAIGPHPDVFNYMGFANRKLGRYDTALSYYGRALTLDPDHRGANEYLGELYIEMGRLDDARRQLAVLDRLCAYGCAEREELARWIVAAR
jgi:tetratricopeptide (TPR) repeat protein